MNFVKHDGLKQSTSTAVEANPSRSASLLRPATALGLPRQKAPVVLPDADHKETSCSRETKSSGPLSVFSSRSSDK